MNLIYERIDISKNPGLRLPKHFSDLKPSEMIAVDFMCNDLVNDFNEADCQEEFKDTADYISWQDNKAISADIITRVSIDDTEYVYMESYISKNGSIILVLTMPQNVYDNDDQALLERAEKSELLYFIVRY